MVLFWERVSLDFFISSTSLLYGVAHGLDLHRACHEGAVGIVDENFGAVVIHHMPQAVGKDLMGDHHRIGA